MDKEDIILFGASRLGEIAFNVLKDEYNIIYFCDNDENKWGKFFCSVKIISPNELVNYVDKAILIASMYYSEISNQLMDIGLKKIYIFSYVDANDITFNKRFFIDKMCDLNIYKNLKLKKGLKKKYVKDFNIIYENKPIKHSNYLSKRNKGKKVLMIAYAFPPIGGSGVQRTAKFVKYLREFGWDPIVITVGKDYITFDKDYTLLDDLPNNIKIYRIDHNIVNSEQLNQKEAQQILDLIYGVLDNQKIAEEYLFKIQNDNCKERYRIFEPDRYISWANDVLKQINEIVEMNEINILYTTSGPYSVNLVGYYLKKSYNIPWVADFRDEWFNSQFAEEFTGNEQLRQNLHKHLEQNILDAADRVITVTPISSQNYRDIFGLPFGKVLTITNGYDEDDFKHIKTEKIITKKFNILFYGSLYFRNIYLKSIVESINQLIDEKHIDINLIEMNLVGKIDLDIKEVFIKTDVHNIVKFHGYMQHLKCIFEGSKSHLLILPIGDDIKYKLVYTGKVFEYIRLGIPILSISPKNSLVEELLKDTGSGQNFGSGDISGIKKYILKNYNNWIHSIVELNIDWQKVREYERQNLTAKLANVFNELILKE